MRVTPIFALPILALAACQSEPTFDERFEDAEAQIEQRAEELEKELEAASPADEESQPAEGE